MQKLSEIKRKKKELNKNMAFAEPMDFPENKPIPLQNQNNFKEVIQEYTNEEDTNSMVKNTFWGMNTKSIVLGFNEKDDALDFSDIHEMSRLWDIMKDPEVDFTWDRGQDYHQISFLLKARVNRSILRPNGGMNERMAQNTQISQSIQSNTLRQGTIGGTGFINNAKNMIDKIIN